MGIFSTQLGAILKQLGWSQIELVRRSKVLSPTQVSRYVIGLNLPEPPSLGALCQIFPENFQEKLLSAYLLDHIPKWASHLVEVRPINSVKGKLNSPTYGRAAEGSEFQAALLYLERRGLSNRHVRDSVISIVRALEGVTVASDEFNEAPHEIQPPQERRDIPLFGTIPAGVPNECLQAEGFIPCHPGKSYPKGVFALRVQGESMSAAKCKLGPIRTGDTVILVPFTTADEAVGKIVAAQIDGGTTLKRLVCPKRKKCFLRAESADSRFSDCLTPLNSLTIQGVVIDKL